jgi:ferric-dicitrate binding protein FerR (iron transport regulator)
MTDERSQNYPNEEALPGWVGGLPRVEADQEVRERLRSAFVSGEIADTGADAAMPLPRAARSRVRPRAWRWFVPAAVAAVAAWFLATNVDRGLSLDVVEVAGTGFVNVDGIDVDVADRAALSPAIREGADITLPDGATLDFTVDGSALYEVVGGTHMTVPREWGVWHRDAAACSLFAGEVRIKTNDRFAGNELRVFTPEGMVVVTGTLLSVQRDTTGTCVCVLEGMARVGVDEDDLEDVTPGFRKVMQADTTMIVPVKDMHRDGVRDFDSRVGNRLK